jgi:hypothetical protein
MSLCTCQSITATSILMLCAYAHSECVRVRWARLLITTADCWTVVLLETSCGQLRREMLQCLHSFDLVHR